MIYMAKKGSDNEELKQLTGDDFEAYDEKQNLDDYERETGKKKHLAEYFLTEKEANDQLSEKEEDVGFELPIKNNTELGQGELRIGTVLQISPDIYSLSYVT